MIEDITSQHDLLCTQLGAMRPDFPSKQLINMMIDAINGLLGVHQKAGLFVIFGKLLTIGGGTMYWVSTNGML